MAAKKLTEFMIVNRRSGKALQASGTENGVVVELADQDKNPLQVWTAVECGEGVKLLNKASGKALDVMANGTSNGTWIQVWEDVDGESQQWKLVTMSPTYKKLLHIMSGKVLDVVDMGVENGTPAQIWEDVEGENQQWKLVSTEDKPAAKKTGCRKCASKTEEKKEEKAAPAVKAEEKKEEKAAPAVKAEEKKEEKAAPVVKAEEKTAAPEVKAEPAAAKPASSGRKPCAKRSRKK